MKICKYCGCSNPDDAKKCFACRSSFVEKFVDIDVEIPESPKTKKCKNCGAFNSENATICIFCRCSLVEKPKVVTNVEPNLIGDIGVELNTSVEDMIALFPDHILLKIAKAKISGVPLKKDIEGAMQILLALVQKNNVLATVELGKLLITMPETYNEGILFLVMAARENNEEAIKFLIRENVNLKKFGIVLPKEAPPIQPNTSEIPNVNSDDEEESQIPDDKVLKITTYCTNGKSVEGTGFIINEGLVITDIRIINGGDYISIIGSFEDEKLHKLKLKKMSIKYGMAVLSFSKKIRKNLEEVDNFELDTDSDYPKKVNVKYYDEDNDINTKRCSIIKKKKYKNIANGIEESFDIECGLSESSIGAPVLNGDKVIGIIHGFKRTQEDVAIVIPAKYINKILKNI